MSNPLRRTPLGIRLICAIFVIPTIVGLSFLAIAEQLDLQIGDADYNQYSNTERLIGESCLFMLGSMAFSGFILCPECYEYEKENRKKED